MKKWYHINEDVEYATDFKFFKENQVAWHINQVGYPTLSIYSRLDGKIFYTMKYTALANYREQVKIIECKIPHLLEQVHEELLSGKFYTNGILID